MHLQLLLAYAACKLGCTASNPQLSYPAIPICCARGAEAVRQHFSSLLVTVQSTNSIYTPSPQNDSCHASDRKYRRLQL
jgi:hypothetical protein